MMEPFDSHCSLFFSVTLTARLNCFHFQTKREPQSYLGGLVVVFKRHEIHERMNLKLLTNILE